MTEPVSEAHEHLGSALPLTDATPTTSDAAAMARQAEAQSELAEYLDRTQQRRRLFPRAALVGLLAGAVAIIFRALLAAGDTLRNGLITWAHQVPAMGWLAPMLFGAVGAMLAVTLVRRYAPEANGSGIPQLGLPPGCIIVRCREGGREWVPNAATRLEPHLRLTVMIAPEATDGPRILRDGCEEPSQ